MLPSLLLVLLALLLGSASSVTMTGPPGEETRRQRTRLTAAEVVAMREALGAETTTIADLAARHTVSRSTIANIATGKSWKDIGGPRQAGHTGPRSSTGYWGVTANGAGNRFSVVIRVNGRQVSLGVFKDVAEAARRYDAVARELGFPPERLNFPDEI
jgi:hypothetical protein